jgi:hypothetical protein
MSSASQKSAKERLSWVEGARQGILSAIGDDIVQPQFKVFPTVDPLRFILKVTLSRPLAKKTREHFRAYLRCHAERHGCELPIIRITDQWIQAEVLTVSRVWSRDAGGKFNSVGRHFEKNPVNRRPA